MTPTPRSVTVAGAGIVGLWQALLLARAGHHVRLVERSPVPAPFAGAASRYAGAMIAPDCEAESAPAIVRDQGRAALALWREVYPGLVTRGTLVVAAGRDRADLDRFERLTQRRGRIDGTRLAALEPDLAGRFDAALYFPDEAHMAAPDALAFLRGAAADAGAEIVHGSAPLPSRTDEITIDCRGIAAAGDLPRLRGVRGERVLVRAADISLTRPVRLLHPRVALYVVPWPDHVYMIGATVIESDDAGPMTIRSAMELLGAAYALHPGFGEAAILDMGAGVRPALPDNIPRALVSTDGRTIRVNGAYRHGFLLAPALAVAVRDHFAGAARHPLLVPS